MPSELWEEIETTLSAQNPDDPYLITKGFYFLRLEFQYGKFSHPAQTVLDMEAHLREAYLADGIYGEDSVEAKPFGNAQERRRFLEKIAIQVPFESLL